jgi:hypothetical protein
MTNTTLLPFQPDAMTAAQLAAVSYLARYTGHTHTLYAYQLRRWFTWSESNDLDPLIGIQRSHIELYIRDLGESGLQVSSVNTMMHGVRGFFRFAYIDGLIPANPAVYARLPEIHTDDATNTSSAPNSSTSTISPPPFPQHQHGAAWKPRHRAPGTSPSTE